MKSKESPVSPKRTIMVDQLVTVSDLQEAKQEIIAEIKTALEGKNHTRPIKWLKSDEVKQLLQISTGKLFKLRSAGDLPFTKIGRVIFYNPHDIHEMLQNRKMQNSIHQ